MVPADPPDHDRPRAPNEVERLLVADALLAGVTAPGLPHGDPPASARQLAVDLLVHRGPLSVDPGHLLHG